MKVLITATVAALSVAALSAPALAGTRGQAMNPEQRAQKLLRFDTNGDQRLSRAEFDAAMARKMARQSNRDPARQARRGGKDKFAKIDRDRDGFITLAELEQRLMRRQAKAGSRHQRGYAPDQGQGQFQQQQDDGQYGDPAASGAGERG